MSCIGWNRELDPKFHAHYAKRLLVPGWAGDVSDAEANYIAQELSRRPELRRVWQVATFTRYRRRITPAVVKRMVAAWAQTPTTAVEERATATVGQHYSATISKTLPVR